VVAGFTMTIKNLSGLEASTAAEAKSLAAVLKTRVARPKGFKRGGQLFCPMCPFRSFARKETLPAHVDKCHVHVKNGTPPRSTKQRRVMEALWNDDQMKRAAAAVFQQAADPVPQENNYLRRSAKVLEEQLKESPSWHAVPSGKKWEVMRMGTTMLLDGEKSRYLLKTDRDPFHRISEHYSCTDQFLSDVLAALLLPDTKGATRRVMSRLRQQAGWKAHFLPTDDRLVATLFEKLLEHPRVREIKESCRAKANKAVVGIDGQFSTLMSVLYQTPHGQKKDKDTENQGPDLHVFLTVQCEDSVLVVHPAPSEKVEHQIAALLEGVGAGGAGQVRGICSDSPEILDDPQTYAALAELEVIIKDVLHVAIRTEKASGEKLTNFSKLLRRCLIKFHNAFDNGRPYYKKGQNLPERQLLSTVMEEMSARTAERRRKEIEDDDYTEAPYKTEMAFVKDVAALAKAFPQQLKRKVESRVTVLGSLTAAMRPEATGYMMNMSKFAARNPDVDLMYGTTRNEAFHKQLKSFFRNVIFQTGRHAEGVAAVATMAKLVSGAMECDPTKKHAEQDLLTMASTFLRANPMCVVPRLDHRTKPNPEAELDTLPKSAKKFRKQ
jgi:hypothetical protein